MEAAEVKLVAETGESACLVISRLPSAAEGPEHQDGETLVTLREARVYRYEFTGAEHLLRVEPAELFNADDSTLRTGRLSPGEAVGLVSIEVITLSGAQLRGRFDVRSSKLSDEAAFGRMLADLAALSVEALHQGFAPSAGAFATRAGEAPQLLYQQFAILHALLVGTDLSWAIDRVLSKPDNAWESLPESRHPGRPLRGSSSLARQLGRPGPRVRTLDGVLPSLPASLRAERTERTLDTMANRYVKFVLERWHALASAVLLRSAHLPGAAMRRGLSQARVIVSQLDALLSEPLFRQVGKLQAYPGDNQVLRKREGYRQVSSAAALVEGSLGLEIDLEDPFLVSRRSIATLYEYWVFVRLAGVVAKACGSKELPRQLFKVSKHGMSLVLKNGLSTRLGFETSIRGQKLLVDLFFNNEFRTNSWTRPMRPDASLVIRRDGHREVWLHFDAKYRVDWMQPFETGALSDEEEAERAGASKRTDLLKMHAYRDAIRDSAGSYVLFPGNQSADYRFSESEFLPGLGAFPFRPDHAEADAAVLETFVMHALKHVAGAATRHSRATFWTARAYSGGGTEAPESAPPAGDLPPADTSVLFGYVRSDEQWRWVHQSGLYNVRSGQRVGAVQAADLLLDSPIVLLYGREEGAKRVALYRREGAWTGMSSVTLRRLGYSNPRGDEYLVTQLRPVAAPLWLELVDVDELRPRQAVMGQPFSASWLDVVMSVQGQGE